MRSCSCNVIVVGAAGPEHKLHPQRLSVVLLLLAGASAVPPRTVAPADVVHPLLAVRALVVAARNAVAPVAQPRAAVVPLPFVDDWRAEP